MKRIIGFSAMLIALPIFMIAGVLFAHWFDENIGMILSFMAFVVWVVVGILVVVEMNEERL